MDTVPVGAAGSASKTRLTGSADAGPATMMWPRNHNVLNRKKTMSDMFEPPKTTPKIAVVGAGAMGSVYAGLFAEAGYDVTVVDINARFITGIFKHCHRLAAVMNQDLGAFQLVPAEIRLGIPASDKKSIHFIDLGKMNTCWGFAFIQRVKPLTEG